MTENNQHVPSPGGRTSSNIEDQYTVINSTEQVERLLQRLKKDRTMLAFLHRTYQSGGTILVEISPHHLVLDRPVDWPGITGKIRVVFKDTARLWNHFNANVLSDVDNNVIVERPTDIYQLQRRAHFRVAPPRGSTAAFNHKDELHEKLVLIDVSAGGMKIGTSKRIVFPLGYAIHDIVLTLMPSDKDGAETTLRIAKARIKRQTVDKTARLVCFGVQFLPTAQEEDNLIRYVRRRELDILRKNV